MNDPIGVTIFGYGMSTKVFHLPLLASNNKFNVKYIVKAKPSSQASISDSRLTTNAKKALNDPDIQLIVIATPNETHAELIALAFEAKKNVVVDKPAVPKATLWAELASQAAKEQLLLTVFQNRRWDGPLLTVEKIVKQQILGKITRYAIYFDRFRPELKEQAWREQTRAASGVWYDLGIHLMDHVFHLFGEPLTIAASLRKERSGAVVDDAFDVTLNYTDFVVQLGAGMLFAKARDHIQLYGDKGAYIKPGLDVQETQLKNGLSPHSEDRGTEDENQWGMVYTPKGNGEIQCSKYASERGNYPAFYANVFEALARGADLAVKPHQVLRVLRWMELGVRSSLEGKTLSKPNPE